MVKGGFGLLSSSVRLGDVTGKCFKLFHILDTNLSAHLYGSISLSDDSFTESAHAADT